LSQSRRVGDKRSVALGTSKLVQSSQSDDVSD
jgi:hypothetical protein